MTLTQFFYEHPIFSFDTFYDFKCKSGSSKKENAHQALHHYIKTHKIISLRRELYAVVPPNVSSSNEILETFFIDPYQLAASVSSDSILAYHTALELHGVSYSNFQRFTFYSAKKIKPFEYQGQLFQPVSQINVLEKINKENIFVISENRGGMTIKLTSLSRTYVDVLDRPDLCGGWEEVCRSISNISVVDIDEIIDYCLLLGNSVLCAKVGFFLEQRGGAFAINKDQLNRLILNRPKSPCYLERRNSGPSKFIKKWNLMVPDRILNYQWEEPDYDI